MCSLIFQENGGKPPLAGLQFAVRKSPDDFCFMNWKWPLIRKVSFWGVISLLVACLCIVIALIAHLPTKCNPHHGWWQGTLFYEVFPASFKVKFMENNTAVTKLPSFTSYNEIKQDCRTTGAWLWSSPTLHSLHLASAVYQLFIHSFLFQLQYT